MGCLNRTQRRRSENLERVLVRRKTQLGRDGPAGWEPGGQVGCGKLFVAGGR